MKEQLYNILAESYNNGSERVSRFPESGDLKEIYIDLTHCKALPPIGNEWHREHCRLFPKARVMDAVDSIFHGADKLIVQNTIMMGQVPDLWCGKLGGII